MLQPYFKQIFDGNNGISPEESLTAYLTEECILNGGVHTSYHAYKILTTCTTILDKLKEQTLSPNAIICLTEVYKTSE